MDKNEGGVTKFSVEKILSERAEKFRRGTLLCCVSENFWQRKRLWIRRGGEFQNFRSKFFYLKVPKNFVEEPFSLSLISGIEKIHGSEGYVTIVRLKFFVSQCRKFS